jgi:hypothetical protein
MLCTFTCSHIRGEFAAELSVSIAAGAAELSAEFTPSITVSTGFEAGYHSSRGLYIDKGRFDMSDSSTPPVIERGCKVEATGELALGPTFVLGVGPPAPNWLAKFAEITDVISVTIPEYKLSATGSAGLKAPSDMTAGCNTCNAACPKYVTEKKVEHGVGLKVRAPCFKESASVWFQQIVP